MAQNWLLRGPGLSSVYKLLFLSFAALCVFNLLTPGPVAAVGLSQLIKDTASESNTLQKKQTLGQLFNNHNISFLQSVEISIEKNSLGSLGGNPGFWIRESSTPDFSSDVTNWILRDIVEGVCVGLGNESYFLFDRDIPLDIQIQRRFDFLTSADVCIFGEELSFLDNGLPLKEDYYYELITSNNNDGTWKIYGSAIDIYSFGECENCDTVLDAYFLINASEDYLLINYPEDFSNITDFNNWELSYKTDKTDAYINIYYTNGEVSYSQLGFSVPAVTEITNIAIPKYNLLTYGTWVENAFLNSESLPYNLAGDTTTFEISLSGESGVPTVSCEGGNWIGDAFCDVLTYLFVPSSTSLNRFSTLSDDIKNKPPMGYFVAVKNVFGGIGESAAPAFVLDGLGALDDFFIPLKTGLAFIFWLSFVVWLYNRIRLFEI